MDDMRELVSMEAVERVFALLAVGGPVLGGAIGAAMGARKRAVFGYLLRGLLLGGLGSANWLLWRMYSALTDHFGLDSVTNLLLNLAIFVALGVGAGLVLGYRFRRAAEIAGVGIGGADGKEDPGC